MNNTELDKSHVGQLFDRIAAKYDFLNHLLSLNIDRQWRLKAAKMIDTECGRVLDVAIGTADFSIAIVKQHSNLQIVGIDLSTEMMKIGKQKVLKENLDDRITFKEGSALALPFEDNSFDVVTCAYGVRNFSDLRKGLAQMQRVLKPNGELVILEFSYPKNKFIAWIYNLYFSHIMPLVGKIISKDKTAYTYFNRSVQGFVWGDEMCKILSEAGFKLVKHYPLTFGITTIYIATK